MMDGIKIYITDYEYHRNGVGGLPFWTIAFELTGEFPMTKYLVAIVEPLHDSEDQYALPDYKHWKVIEPTNLHSNWRGDRLSTLLKADFEDILRNKA